MMRHRRVVCLCAVLSVMCLTPLVGGPAETAKPAARQPNLRVLPRPGIGVPLGPRGNYTFSWAPGALAAARAAVPHDVMVYRTVRSTPTKEKVRALAVTFGVDVPDSVFESLPATDAADLYRVQLGGPDAETPGDYEFRVRDNGLYMVLVRNKLPEPGRQAGTASPFTDKDAEQAADQFLKSTGLLPEGCRRVASGPALVTDYEMPGQEKLGHDVLSRGVRYQRFLDGIPAGVFALDFNMAGELCLVDSTIPDVMPEASYPILSVEEAFAQLPEADVIYGPWQPETQEATVDAVTLEYYVWDFGETVQPVFRFSGRAGAEPKPFFALLPAVRPEYLEPVWLPPPAGAGISPSGGKGADACGSGRTR